MHIVLRADDGHLVQMSDRAKSPVAEYPGLQGRTLKGKLIMYSKSFSLLLFNSILHQTTYLQPWIGQMIAHRHSPGSVVDGREHPG